MRVLVVDDNAAVTAQLQEALSDVADTVHVAGNSAGALALAAQSPLDLAVADVRLGPNDSGSTLARELLERHSVPTLLITGFDGLDEEEAGAHALGVLSKPFSMRDLISSLVVIRTVLSGDDPGPLPRNLTLFRTLARPA